MTFAKDRLAFVWRGTLAAAPAGTLRGSSMGASTRGWGRLMSNVTPPLSRMDATRTTTADMAAQLATPRTTAHRSFTR
jgi:hypothetical protein